MEILSSKILFLSFLMACVGGCSYQIIVLSRQYFKYTTSSRVETLVQYEHFLPGVTLCAPFNQLTTTNETQLTISKMVNLTLSAEETIESCRLRLSHDYVMTKFNKNVCLQYFGVSKHFSGKSICYQYTLRENLQYSITNVANALINPLIIYILTLRNELRKAKEVQLIAFFPLLHSTSTFPIDSRKFGETINLLDSDNVLHFRTKKDNYTFLPAPYDTQCNDAYMHCIPRCITKLTIKHYRKFPFMGVTQQHLDIEPLNYSDIHQDNGKTWIKIQDQCKRQCLYIPCSQLLVSTNTIVSSNKWNKGMILLASVPYTAEFTFATIPTLSGIEYFSGLCSTIGTWFGFSVISMRQSISRLIILTLMKNVKTKSCKFPISGKTIRLSSVINLLFAAACIIGCLAQTIEICNTYFAYRTYSTVFLRDTSYHRYRIPSLSLCFPVRGMINVFRYQNYSINQRPAITPANIAYHQNIADLSVKEIFHQTPDPIDILDFCQFRNESLGFLSHYPKNLCLERLTITKGVTGSHICYITNPMDDDDTYVMKDASYSLRSSKEIYNIFLKMDVKQAIYATAAVFTYETPHFKLPSLSRNFGAQLSLFDTTIENNNFFMKNSWVAYRFMPFPYDTNCDNSSLESYESVETYTCFRRCLLKKYKEIDRVPFSEIVTNPNNTLKSLGLKDMENETVKKFVEKTEQFCQNQCTRNPCFLFYTFTSISKHSHENLKSILISLITSSYISLDITFTPVMTIVEFIQFLCNPVTIWLGFSIISLHPKRLKYFYQRYVVSRA